MNKFNHLTRFIFILISIFGLCACSESEMPDLTESEKDEWKLYQPKIQRQDAQSLVSTEANVSQAKEKFQFLNLSDRFIFSEKDKNARNVKLTVKSTCFLEAHGTLENEYKILLTRDMYIYEFLTADFLSQVSFNPKIKLCTFDFIAVNDLGSRHFFNLKTIEIRNTSQHNDFFKIESEKTVTLSAQNATQFVSISDLKSHKFSLQNRTTYAQLSCNHFQSPILPIVTQTDLQKFFVEKTEATYHAKRYDCRVIGLNSNNQVTQISNQFNIINFEHKPKSEGRVQMTTSLSPEELKAFLMRNVNSELNVPVAQFKIYNPSDEALFFKIKNENNFNLSTQLVIKKNKSKKPEYYSQKLDVKMIVNGKYIPEGETFQMVVASQSGIGLEINIQLPNRIKCVNGYTPYAVNVRGSIHNKSLTSDYFITENSSEIQLGSLDLVEVLDIWGGFQFVKPVSSKKTDTNLCR